MGIIKKIFSSLTEAMTRTEYITDVVERDSVGNWDMSDPRIKTEALYKVAPLGYVLSRVSSMASDGVPYVVDSKNNEIISDEYNEIRRLINYPNPMQDFSQFLKCVSFYLKLYGFCPVYLIRATKKSPVKYIVPIPPDIFYMEDFPDIRKIGVKGKAWINIDGYNVELDDSEYSILHEGVFDIKNGIPVFYSPVNAIGEHIRNYIGQIKARGNLIINGGGKGIIHGNDTSEFGNLELTPQEKDELNRQFNSKFGLVGKAPIIVTRAKVGWIPTSFDVGQLQLHEEDLACMKDISNAIGVNPNLFISDSTFQNQEAVKKSAYQDVIIPDSNRIARALTGLLCTGDIMIKIDYTHVPCLQQDRSASALALKNTSLGLEKLLSLGLITREEARIELSKHIDINPNEGE